MTEEEYQQMLADIEDGTKGSWIAEGRSVYKPADKDDMDQAWWIVATSHEECDGGDDEANARRIARVPDLEAEVIRLRKNAAEDAWLMSAYHEWCRQNDCMPSSSDLLKARGVIKG